MHGKLAEIYGQYSPRVQFKDKGSLLLHKFPMGSYHVNATHCVFYILNVVSVAGSLGFRVTKSKGKAENKFVSCMTFINQATLRFISQPRYNLGVAWGLSYNIVP